MDPPSSPLPVRNRELIFIILEFYCNLVQAGYSRNSDKASFRQSFRYISRSAAGKEGLGNCCFCRGRGSAEFSVLKQGLVYDHNKGGLMHQTTDFSSYGTKLRAFEPAAATLRVVTSENRMSFRSRATNERFLKGKQVVFVSSDTCSVDQQSEVLRVTTDPGLSCNFPLHRPPTPK